MSCRVRGEWVVGELHQTFEVVVRSEPFWEMCRSVSHRRCSPHRREGLKGQKARLGGALHPLGDALPPKKSPEGWKRELRQ